MTNNSTVPPDTCDTPNLIYHPEDPGDAHLDPPDESPNSSGISEQARSQIQPCHTTFIENQPTRSFNRYSPVGEPMLTMQLPAFQVTLPGHAPVDWDWNELDALAAEFHVDIKETVVKIIRKWGAHKAQQQAREESPLHDPPDDPPPNDAT